MKIRPLQYEDEMAIRFLVSQATTEVGKFGQSPISGEDLTRMVMDSILKGQSLFCAEVDDRVVGYCAWIVMPEAAPGTIIGLGTYVMPEHRGQKISSAMREEATEHWRSLGFDEVVGTAAVGNEAGIESAKAAGFSISGYEMKFDLRGSDGE